MRVTLVIQKLVGLRGGAERIVIDLARELGRRGHHVTLATFEPAAGPPGYDAADLSLVDLFPTSLRSVLRRSRASGRLESSESYASTRGNSPPISHLKWRLTHGLFARRLTRWLAEHPQDVVVGFLPPAISAVALAGDRLGAERPRTIASTHNVPAEDFGPSARWDQNPVTRRTNLWALETVDVVTVLQEEFVEQLPVRARGHAIVLPNGVSRLAAPTDRRREATILGVGRLTDVKRFDLLIEAFARIAQDVPEWEVSIYGEGTERADLEDLIARLDLQEQVHLRGTTAEIAEVYDRARILCHPARFEGFGLSIAEAIMHGVYVLASSACSGANRLVEDGASGVLVDEGADPVAAFASGLRQLIDAPPAEPLRRAAAEQLADRLLPSRAFDLWERLLSS